ncbi:MAG: hypothetical protein AAF658_04185 [Myxococcota bacterium]
MRASLLLFFVLANGCGDECTLEGLPGNQVVVLTASQDVTVECLIGSQVGDTFAFEGPDEVRCPRSTTRLRVGAPGFVTFEQELTPLEDVECNGPADGRTLNVELARE